MDPLLPIRTDLLQVCLAGGSALWPIVGGMENPLPAGKMPALSPGRNGPSLMANFLKNLSPERRILFATSLCVMLSVVFTLLMPPPAPSPEEQRPQITAPLPGQEASLSPKATDTAVIQSPTITQVAEALVAATPTVVKGGNPLDNLDPGLEVREVVIDTPSIRFKFSTRGACLTSMQLKEYTEIDPPVRLLEAQRDSAITPDIREFWQKRIEEVLQRQEQRGNQKIHKGDPVPESFWVELVPNYEDTDDFPLALLFGKDLSDGNLVYECDQNSQALDSGGMVQITFTAKTATGLTLRKTLAIHSDHPQFDVEVQVSAEDGLKAHHESIGEQFVLEWPDGLAHLPFHYPGAQEENHMRALLDDSMQSPTLRDWMHKQAIAAGQAEEFRYPLDGRIGWICIETRYFIATMIPQGENCRGVYMAEKIDRRPSIDTRMGIGLISPLTDQPEKFVVYAGPKLSDTLASLGGGLDRVVYDSWFGSICLLVEWLLGVFYTVIPSYGVAIILLCIFSKMLLYPLTYKQAQTQMKMAELQPKIAELKEKFKDDAQKLSQEQMKLWKKHGVNPASGCLPMLAQLPIFIALYRTIQSSIDLRGAPFLWISDLSLPDMTFFLPTNLPFLGNALNILPVLMTLISLWQMHEQKKMMPDPNQAQIMMFMTVFFFFILYHFSSGLVLYWMTNSLTQMIQQKIMEHLGHAATPAARMATVAATDTGGSTEVDLVPRPDNRPNPSRKVVRSGRKKTGKS